MEMRNGIACLILSALACVAAPVHAQSTVEYFHTDALGTPVAVTNASGVVTERYEYDPYGSQLAGGEISGPGYTGHVQDPDTGLTYMQQRYYDPQIGRFLSVDAVAPLEGFVPSFNRYKYAANSPFRYFDPDGRYVCEAGNQCKEVDAAVQLINEAAKNAPEGSRIARIAAFLGKPGVANGVVITGKVTDPKNAGEAATQDGETRIGLNFTSFSGSKDRLASTLIHEGSHGSDQIARERNGEDAMTNSKGLLMAGEQKAGLAEAHLFQALGRNNPYGLYSTKGGINYPAVSRQAERSVEYVCGGKHKCDP